MAAVYKLPRRLVSLLCCTVMVYERTEQRKDRRSVYMRYCRSRASDDKLSASLFRVPAGYIAIVSPKAERAGDKGYFGYLTLD